MHKQHYSKIMSAVCLLTFLLLSCQELPPNPYEDPANVDVKLFVKNNVTVIQEQSFEIGIGISIPKHVQKIEVDFSNSASNNVSLNYDNPIISPDTVYTAGKLSSAGKKEIIVTVYLINGLTITEKISVDVIDKKMTLTLEKKVTDSILITDRPDTFEFSAVTNPSGGSILYDASVQPAMDSGEIKQLSSVSGFQVIINTAHKGNYTLKVKASCGLTADSISLPFSVLQKPSIKILHSDSTLVLNEKDTMMVSAINDSTDEVKLEIVNGIELQNVVSEFKQVSKDSLWIIFRPVEAKQYLFKFSIQGKYSCDTVIMSSNVYDSTVKDFIPPAILKKSGPDTNSRFFTDSGSFVFSVTDESGIQNVSCSLNDSNLSVLNVNTNEYVVTYKSLLPGKNIFIIYASDNSEINNKDSTEIVFFYNLPPAISVFEPADGASGINKNVKFIWSGSDKENDTILYSLYMGTSETSLENVYTGKDTACIVPCLNSKEYFWKVRAIDSKDTFTESAVRVFKTNNLPLIEIKQPENGTVNIAQPISFKWSGSDIDNEDNSQLKYFLCIDTNQNNLVNRIPLISSAFDTSGLLYGHKYYWKVIVSDNKDSVSSQVMAFTTGIPAQITVQPVNDTLKIPDSTASFYVAADGHGKDVTYKWLKNGVETSSAQTNCITVQSGNNGDRYRCVVSNGTGKPDTSNEAVLSVAFRIKTEIYGNGTGNITPANPYVVSGSSQVFSINSDGRSIIAKLFKGNVQIPVNSTCTLSSVTACDSVKAMLFEIPSLLKPIPSKNAQFLMGKDDQTYLPDVAHLVKFTYGFYMDSTEVTQKDYSALYNSPWINPAGIAGDNYPAAYMVWTDAVLYCNLRSKQFGLDTVYSYTYSQNVSGYIELGDIKINYDKIGFRLPTESEWEFAYRAGTTTDFYWKYDILPLDSSVISS